MGQRTWATLLSLVVLVTILSLNFVQSTQKVLLASNFAIYDQLKHLAPKNQKVALLTPFGQDAHTFRPSPKNITQMVDAVAFFYVSKGLDQWVSKLDALKDMKHGFDLSSDMQWREMLHEDDHHEGEHGDHHDDEDEIHDPHYWLDINNQINSAKSVAEKLQELFPQDRDEIDNNYRDYVAQLHVLNNIYKKRLQKCQKSELFVTHDAYSYLAKNHAFTIESVVGLSPESSPNPIKMKEIIEKLSKNGVKTIFFESFSSNKIATAIAHEIGIDVDVLDTLGTISADDAKANQSYKDIMIRNLNKMVKALECH